jgi:PAS domain S-box-containing protein
MNYFGAGSPSDAILAQVLKSSREGFWYIDNETTTLDVNEAMCDILGRPRDDIIGRSIFEFVDDASADIFRREVSARRTGKRGAYEVALRRSDGSNVPCLNNATPVYDDNGQKIASIGLYTDISEIKQVQCELEHARDELEQRVRERTAELEQANEALKNQIAEREQAERAVNDSEGRYRQIAEMSPDGMFVHVDEKIVFANGSLARILGYPSPDDFIGMTAIDLVPPAYRAEIMQRRAAARTGKNLEIRTADFQRCDGSTVAVERTGARVSWEGKTAFLILIRDVTERKRAEQTLLAAKEEAELASRAKSEFLANMSHELRTPLNSIIGFSDLLTDPALYAPGDTESPEHAAHIYQSGEHLLALINDILDLSKIEAGTAALQEEDTVPAEIIESCLNMVGERAKNGGVELIVDSNVPALPRLRADKTRIKQVLINLLSNAVKFTEPGGSVTIKAAFDAARGFVLQVADSGIGIAADDIPRALARFEQLESALDRKYEGTGLGLPLAKSLVEQHGGTLELESQLGVGTTVTVCLPADRAVAAG